jgi:hypothetical protein
MRRKGTNYLPFGVCLHSLCASFTNKHCHDCQWQTFEFLYESCQRQLLEKREFRPMAQTSFQKAKLNFNFIKYPGECKFFKGLNKRVQPLNHDKTQF